jgi:hypothetical protein
MTRHGCLSRKVVSGKEKAEAIWKKRKKKKKRATQSSDTNNAVVSIHRAKKTNTSCLFPRFVHVLPREAGAGHCIALTAIPLHTSTVKYTHAHMHDDVQWAVKVGPLKKSKRVGLGRFSNALFLSLTLFLSRWQEIFAKSAMVKFQSVLDDDKSFFPDEKSFLQSAVIWKHFIFSVCHVALQPYPCCMEEVQTFRVAKKAY